MSGIGKRHKPASIFLALFLAILIIVVSGINFYLVFLLNKTPSEENDHTIRVYAGLSAGIILILIVSLIVLACFFFELLARLFVGKSGLFAIFFIIVLLVLMGLDFAILPQVKNANYERARLFAIIVGVIGLILFVVTLLIFVIKTIKRGKQDREYKETLKEEYSK